MNTTKPQIYLKSRIRDNNSLISAKYALNLQKEEIIKKIEAKIEESSVYMGLDEFMYFEKKGFLDGLNEAIKLIKQTK